MTSAQLRRDAVVKQRLELRKKLWPEIADEHLWNRKVRKGFSTIPRTMSLIFTAAYQDGLIHAFERMLAMARTGQYSHRHDLANQIRQYIKIKKQNLHARRYEDVAYIEGYINGLF